ncbi:MBL fold metallo-hydrolase [Halegenticoccus tardaugens]|uniref:MBL fold metallo-hydrolase n=1 Tax=Halegenticoccus tardaugens TaxID=2071624 RepID=UPI00100B3B7A|nr:MBL fold metallo-hydrolase [Halegenticoccus tardaugens]
MPVPPNRVFRLELGSVNAYLVDDDEGVTLIDAGKPWDVEKIRTRIADAGFDVEGIDRVLVTHFDVDHVGTLAALDLDAPVYMGDPDARFLAGSERPPLSNHKGLIQRLFGLLLTRPDFPIETVEDGDRIGGFVAHRLPGHTPGHTAYVHEEYGVAFVGDVVRAVNGELAASPWIITYDTATNAESIRTLADRTPDVEVVAVGHGNPIREEGGDALRRLADSL